ncbi:MAG: hypothetical protein FE037_05135 [Thermoplasmata archaeon]|nr:MAG: hypothetical protein FE042_05620 [Thermoplasmata archaeon]KAA0009720.1 MAG: hypothetical protein FE037_05135 [Thermoplasmata archaeon]
MRGNGFALISVLLLISLALIGFAYAHWEEIITVEGQVSTGKVDAEITSWSCDDPPGTPGNPVNDPGYDKDVASCVCSIIDSQKAKVTINNAYPCYTVTLNLVVKNTGTIPIALGEVRVDGNTIPDQEWTPIDLDGDGKNDTEFYVIFPQGSADPNKCITTSLRIHIMEDAKQDTTYTFTIEFDFWNWNEV